MPTLTDPAPRRMVVDWRGVPDLTKSADFYSVASNATIPPREKRGNPAARLMRAISMTVHYAPNGSVVNEPFNNALVAIAQKCGAVMPAILGVEPNGYSTKGIDVTRRGFSSAALTLIKSTFPDCDGYHWDIFTPLSDPVDPWDRVLAGMAGSLRASGKLVIGQQFHPTPATMACNGAFWEESPTNFSYTMARHAADANAFREVLAFADPGREVVYFSEIREPWRFPKWYLDMVHAWCVENDFVLSVGRGETAVAA